MLPRDFLRYAGLVAARLFAGMRKYAGTRSYILRAYCIFYCAVWL